MKTILSVLTLSALQVLGAVLVNQGGVTNQGGTTFSTPVTASPVTLSAWVYCTNFTATAVVLGVERAPSGTYGRWWIYVDASGALSAQAGVTAVGYPTAVTSNKMSLNTWAHICGVFTNTVSAYLNGVISTNTPTAVSPPSLTLVNVGRGFQNTAISFPLIGAVDHVAVWNTALTASEIVQLASGVPANKIRPDKLVWLPELSYTGTVLPDTWGSISLTLSNAPKIVAGPPQLSFR